LAADTAVIACCFSPTIDNTHGTAHFNCSQEGLLLLSLLSHLLKSRTIMTLSPTLGSVLLAPSPAGVKYDAMYYLKGAAAGGICCSITHGALTPVDVVKTRVQLDPVKVG
jgi:hypothetical protein